MNKKDYTPITIRMERSIAEKLEQYCKESGMSKTATIERAVNCYIDQRIKEQNIVNNMNIDP